MLDLIDREDGSGEFVGPVGVGAASEPWILADEQTSLLMRIAATHYASYSQNSGQSGLPVGIVVLLIGLLNKKRTVLRKI